MNILPKKSWHVRNKDNVARVRKDEAQAAEEERVRRKRVELAEQEARTDFLRKKARLSLPDEYRGDGSSMVEHSKDSAHINFFQEVEEGKGTNKGNKEYEEEKRKEKERQEKALGILTYLGQSAAEAQTSRPWYQEVPGHNCKEKDGTAKDEKVKKLLDPLHVMEKYLQKKSGEKSKFKEKQHKGKANESKKESRSTKPSLEQMRQERRKREAAERARAEALLTGKKEPAAPEQEMDDRKRSYNSQFNPQLARKPKVREEQEWRY